MQVAQAKTVNDGKLAEPLRAPGNPASAAGKPFRGVVLFVAALLLFACMDTTTKFLSTHYDVPLVVAIRYIVHCLLMIVLLAPSQGRRLVQTRRTGLVLGGRGADALASVALPEHGRHRGLGHFLFTAAYRHAPASLLAPMNYLQSSGPGCSDGWCSATCRTT